MIKLILFDGVSDPLKPHRYMNGDVISALDDSVDFGTDELASPLFACVEVPGMTISEARSRAAINLPDKTGKYIPRPSLYRATLDTMLGVDRGRTVVHTVTRGTLMAALKVRDPLLNPGWIG